MNNRDLEVTESTKVWTEKDIFDQLAKDSYPSGTFSSELLNFIWSKACDELHHLLSKFQAVEFALVGKFYKQNSLSKTLVFVPNFEFLQLTGLRLLSSDQNYTS